jgi:hypothetical protein
LHRPACPELEDISEVLEQEFEFTGIVFGSDVGSFIIFFIPRQEYLRERMSSQFDIGVPISSFEHRIVERFMFFDEIIF